MRVMFVRRAFLRRPSSRELERMECCARQAEQVYLRVLAGERKRKGRAAEAGKATRLILRPRGMGAAGGHVGGQGRGRVRLLFLRRLLSWACTATARR